MKTLSTNLKNHYAESLTTLATCWLLVRRDGTATGFTDSSNNIPFTDTFSGSPRTVTYSATTGMLPSGIKAGSDLSVDNMDIDGVLNAVSISESDLSEGLYDGATVWIFQVNYKNLADGCMILKSGYLGNVTKKRVSFQAEIRGKSQALAQIVGRIYTPTCDATFGDSRCKVNLAPLAVTGAITSVTDNRTFSDSSRTEADKYFQFGVIYWMSGDNNGRSMEIKSYLNAGGSFVITQKMFKNIQVGDTYAATPGCNKNLVDANGCSGFSNTINFRGFPYVPGPDKALNYPNAH